MLCCRDTEVNGNSKDLSHSKDGDHDYSFTSNFADLAWAGKVTLINFYTLFICCAYNDKFENY